MIEFHECKELKSYNEKIDTVVYFTDMFKRWNIHTEGTTIKIHKLDERLTKLEQDIISNRDD